MKIFDVLLMALSCLLPVLGLMKQIPLELSLFMGGLLFLTSFGSYLAKKTEARLLSWVAYTVFITFLLSLWDQYITTVSLMANGKLAVCIAIIAFLFRFRTYAITFGLIGLWVPVLWKAKQTQSLTAIQNMLQILHGEKINLLIFVIAFLLGGLLGKTIKTEKDRKREEKTNSSKSKKRRNRLRLSIPIPRISIPKFNFKKIGRKTRANHTRSSDEAQNIEQSFEGRSRRYRSIQTDEQVEALSQIEPTTRMERRRIRDKVN